MSRKLLALAVVLVLGVLVSGCCCCSSYDRGVYSPPSYIPSYMPYYKVTGSPAVKPSVTAVPVMVPNTTGKASHPKNVTARPVPT